MHRCQIYNVQMLCVGVLLTSGQPRRGRGIYIPLASLIPSVALLKGQQTARRALFVSSDYLHPGNISPIPQLPVFPLRHNLKYIPVPSDQTHPRSQLFTMSHLEYTSPAGWGQDSLKTYKYNQVVRVGDVLHISGQGTSRPCPCSGSHEPKKWSLTSYSRWLGL